MTMYTFVGGRLWWAVVILGLGLGLNLGWYTTVYSASPDMPPTVQAEQLHKEWKSALGAAGPALVDKVIAQFTPSCLQPSTVQELQAKQDELRASIVKSMQLDFDRRPLSAEVQRTVQRKGYQIDVLRIEVFPGLYMSANLYRPEKTAEHSAPLVVLPPGCSSGVQSAYIQQMGANLARMGMVVLVAEGYCENGARRPYAQEEQVGYASQLLGSTGFVERYIQELISSITWVVEQYPLIDSSRIGAAGYSYGGQISLTLAAVDLRIRTVSLPATYIGDPCTNFTLTADIQVEKYPPAHFPNFSWSSPLRTPILPISWRLFLLYPRPLQVTVGSRDTSAHPSFIGPVMDYVQSLYALGNYQSSLLYRTDTFPHGYMVNRRQDTYAWFAHTLLGEPLVPHPELTTTLLSAKMLFPNLTGTVTPLDIVGDLVDAEVTRRGEATESVAPDDQVEQFDADLQAALPLTLPVTQTLVWERNVGDIVVRAYRAETTANYYPVFIFENQRQANHQQALFLPTAGTYQQLDQILPLLARYHTVISIDYLGIGELKSNRLLLHTFARYFMHHQPNLPQMNIALLYAYLQTLPAEPLDIIASGWATSFYAFALKSLDTEHVGGVTPAGLPDDELEFLKSGQKIPDLLLWADLFKQTSVRELAAGLPQPSAVSINADTSAGGPILDESSWLYQPFRALGCATTPSSC